MTALLMITSSASAAEEAEVATPPSKECSVLIFKETGRVFNAT